MTEMQELEDPLQGKKTSGRSRSSSQVYLRPEPEVHYNCVIVKVVKVISK